MALRLLDLFSGIGGFSLGLEQSQAFRTVAFCEVDKLCHKVLSKHWPEAPIYDDVKELTAERLASDGITVDAICGGFPCQDISTAGKRVGIKGARSGLWSEFARLIGEIRPRYVFVENVPDLLIRGLDTVLSDLAALRYDAEWHCIPASTVGAPHRRDRLWIIAYPSSDGQECNSASHEWRSSKEFFIGRGLVEGINKSGIENRWSAEPGILRVAYGVRNRPHRIRMLGNSIVPAIPKIIGESIAEYENAQA